MRPVLRLLLAALLLAGGALALEYRVDAGGGPAGLAEAVQEAFAAWAAVEGAEVEAEPAEDAPNLIRYGDATRLGPDVVTLTLSQDLGEGAGLSVLVHPEAQDVLEPALLHETGLLLGLNAAQNGVMNPALSADSPTELTDQDRAALRAQATSAPEDVNQDGVVNFYDLAALAADYGRTGVNLASDINGDGVVDDRDLALLREAYVFSPPAETPPVPETPAGEPADDALPEVPETGAPAEGAPDETPEPEGDVPEETPGTSEGQETTGEEPPADESGEPPAQDAPEDRDEDAPPASEEPGSSADPEIPETPTQPGDETP